jgi:hypothetical protein
LRRTRHRTSRPQHPAGKPIPIGQYPKLDTLDNPFAARASRGAWPCTCPVGRNSPTNLGPRGWHWLLLWRGTSRLGGALRGKCFTRLAGKTALGACHDAID